jgi:tetratricopeptide (TPR) repeat protein
VGDRVVVKEGGSRWQAESGQYLLAFEGDPAEGSLRVVEAEPEAPVPADAQAWFERGAVLERDDPQAARQAYEQAIVLDASRVDARLNLGSLLHEGGLLDEAARAYLDALKACGNDPVLLYNFGVLLEDMGRKPEAIRAYEAALRGNAALADAHYNLALLCQQLGRPKDAIRHMSQYRRLSSS